MKTNAESFFSKTNAKSFFSKTHLLVILLLSLSVQADTIYVNQKNKPKGADGQSWSTAYKNLNKALKTAKSGDDIWVAKGEYILKPTRLNGINIYGGFSATETELGQREIVNNETKLYGRLALQNALLSSVTILEEPERHTVVEINFNEKQKTTRFRPDRKKMQKEREGRHQRDLKDARNRPAVIFEENKPWRSQSDVSGEAAYSNKKRSDLNEVQANEQRPEEQRQTNTDRKGPPRPEEVMQKFDTNADGKISKAEAPDKMKRNWKRLDKNGDGYVEEREMTPPPQRQGDQRPPQQERR